MQSKWQVMQQEEYFEALEFKSDQLTLVNENNNIIYIKMES